jgi:GAF domain-containing protein
MKAPIPTNEAQRLEALRSYQVLDTEAEQIYDGITALAAQICEVPVAMVSLVDESRQWFKSKLGVHQQQTPRDVAFCAHAILEDEPLYVSDAMADSRFADSALVTGEPHIRFYAGVPLVNPEGFVLGTLCVIDRKPRQLSARQQEAMRILARQVMSLLEMRRISARLADALANVKTLESLLPMCAWCHRIRDDKGHWSTVEAYLKARTDTEFTHGICQDCRAKHFPAKLGNQ